MAILSKITELINMAHEDGETGDHVVLVTVNTLETIAKTIEEQEERIAIMSEGDDNKLNHHEVACIIANLFGDPCACNFNDIDEWLPQHCDFTNTCCPNPVGVVCWEQYLKHLDKRPSKDGDSDA